MTCPYCGSEDFYEADGRDRCLRCYAPVEKPKAAKAEKQDKKEK